jgi:hypothetical protein
MLERYLFWFEQAFSWAMRHGSRILFAAACLLLLTGMLSFGWSLSRRAFLDWGEGYAPSLLSALIYSHFAPAAYLLFGAVLTERLRRET